MIPKKIALLIVLIWLVSPILAACSQDNPSSLPVTASPQATSTQPATAEPSPVPSPTPYITRGTISIWHSWDGARLPMLVQIIADFQKEYPDVQFDVLYVPPEDLMERFITAAREGRGPTVVLGPAQWGPQFFNAGLLANLEDQVDPGLLSGLSSAAMGSVQYQGHLIGLPYTLQGVVLYQNRSVVLDVPTTFDEMVALANRSTHGEIIGADLERSFFYSGGNLFGIGGELMDANGDPAFNNEKGVAWVNLLASFEQAGATNFLSDQDLDAFKTGKVGFIIDGTWNMRAITETVGAENITIVPWPATNDGKMSGFVQADNLYLNAHAGFDEQVAAEEFMQYFLARAPQEALAERGLIPAMRDTKVVEPLMAQAMQALAGGVAYPIAPEMAVYPAAMDVALKKVFDSGALPQDALQEASDTIRTALDNLRSTPAP